jgi:hypothetical protein
MCRPGVDRDDGLGCVEPEREAQTVGGQSAAASASLNPTRDARPSTGVALDMPGAGLFVALGVASHESDAFAASGCRDAGMLTSGAGQLEKHNTAADAFAQCRRWAAGAAAIIGP